MIVNLSAVYLAIFLSSCSETPPESNVLSSETQTAETLTKGDLVYAPAVYHINANAGDKTVSAHFTVKNEGKTQVKITNLETTCSCLKVEVADSLLDPGESTRIDAVFEIEKLMGEAEKMIMVRTDQEGIREAFLPVKVSVPPVLEITPKNVKWKLGEKPQSKTFTFRTLRDKPIHVTEVSSSRPDLVTAEFEEIEKGREYKITVTPKSTDDFLLGFVRITNDIEIDDHKMQMGFFTITDD